MNTTLAVTLTIIGRIKGLILTDLTESDYDLAILKVSGDTVHDADRKIKANPTFLARQLGMSNAIPEELKAENQPVWEDIDDEPKADRDKRLKKFNKETSDIESKRAEFLANRAAASRKFLMSIKDNVIGEHYRFVVQERKKGETHYEDESGNAIPHTASGLYLSEMEVLDDTDIADYELDRAAITHGVKVQTEDVMNHVDRVAERRAKAKERRAQLLNAASGVGRAAKQAIKEQEEEKELEEVEN